MKRTSHRRGWTPIRSAVLGGEIIMAVDNENIAIPERYSGAVRYTAEEAAKLEGLGDGDIRDVHRAKKVFRGYIANTKE